MLVSLNKMKKYLQKILKKTLPVYVLQLHF